MSNFSQFVNDKVQVWVSGTTYSLGAIVLSPAATYQAFVRVVAGAGTTDPNADTTNWRPIGGRAIKSVQRGTLALNSGSATGDATITSVVTTKCELHMLGFTGGSSATMTMINTPYLSLVNATTVRATRGFAVTETHNVSWQVVEYYT